MIEKCKYCDMAAFNDNIIHRSKHEYVDLTGYLIYADDALYFVIASRPANENECNFTQTMLLLNSYIPNLDMSKCNEYAVNQINCDDSIMWQFSDLYIYCNYDKVQ